MSKSKKNYSDCLNVVNNHVADTIRVYLVSNEHAKGEILKFKD